MSEHKIILITSSDDVFHEIYISSEDYKFIKKLEKTRKQMQKSVSYPIGAKAEIIK